MANSTERHNGRGVNLNHRCAVNSRRRFPHSPRVWASLLAGQTNLEIQLASREIDDTA